MIESGLLAHLRSLMPGGRLSSFDAQARGYDGAWQQPKAKAPTPEAPSTLAKTAQDTAERRQVTMIFSDLVGSTALSARMDPEDLREVISAYQKCVAQTVQRFGGFVAKYMGDGVLVYFGYPQAHEDDAERAVRAGLELIQAEQSTGGLRSRSFPSVRFSSPRTSRTSSRIFLSGWFAGIRASGIMYENSPP
jgi:class 3 adenylate cyclase